MHIYNLRKTPTSLIGSVNYDIADNRTDYVMRNIGRSDIANQIGPKPDFITPNFYRILKEAAEIMR